MAQLINTQFKYDLSQTNVYEEILNYVTDVIFVGPTIEAARFAKKLRKVIEKEFPNLNQTDVALYNKYQLLIIQASFIGLPFLNSNDVINLIANYYLDSFNLGVDFKDQLRNFLLGLPLLEDRDELRKRLIPSLEENNQVLGGKVDLGQGEILGTVANWIKYRNSMVGISDASDLLKEKNFLSQDAFIAKLANPEKLKLFELYNLYRWLNYSSFMQEGFEEPIIIIENGQVKALSDGVLVNLKESPAWKITNDLMGGRPGVAQEVIHQINIAPSVMMQSTPAFYFDVNDEEEIDKIKQHLGDASGSVLEKQLRILVDQIVTDYKFIFTDDVTKKRFTQIVVSYLKDVRGIIEVRDVLKKTTTQGGMGMDDSKAEAVIKVLQKIRVNLSDILTKMEPMAELIPEVPQEKELKSFTPQVKKLSAEDIAKWRQEMISEMEMPELPKAAKREQVKPALADIRSAPRALGPLEELKEITLTDFRRLGTGAVDSIEKIMQKIQLIGEGGIGRKVQAMKSWQSCPLYRMYVEIGRESIEQGKPVTEIISSHQANNEESVTVAEFEAIVDLNQKLRF